MRKKKKGNYQSQAIICCAVICCTALIKCQCCPHIETSQLIYTANQLTGFYMRATLALNWLIFKITRTMWKQMNQLNSKLVKLTLKSFATWMFKTGALLLNTVAHPPYHLNLKQQMLR